MQFFRSVVSNIYLKIVSVYAHTTNKIIEKKKKNPNSSKKEKTADRKKRSRLKKI